MPPGRPLKPTKVKPQWQSGMSAIAGRFHGQCIADGDTGAGTAGGTGSRRSPVWDRYRDSAITWLSPVSDVDAVVQVCNLVDDVPQARRWYRENGSTRDPHALIVAQKMLQSALSGIGFDPASRSRLGVAGVRRVTALEDLNSASAHKRYHRPDR